MLPLTCCRYGGRLSQQMQWPLGKDNIYAGHGHYTHRHPTSKWASPYLDGQHGTQEECLVLYGTATTSESLVCLLKRGSSESTTSGAITPIQEPCVAYIPIAAVDEHWQQRRTEPIEAELKRKVQKAGRIWAGKALFALVATPGDVGRAAGLAVAQLASPPPLPPSHWNCQENQAGRNNQSSRRSRGTTRMASLRASPFPSSRISVTPRPS